MSGRAAMHQTATPGREPVDDERPPPARPVAEPAVGEPEHQVHPDRGQRGDRDRAHDRGHVVGGVVGGLGRAEHRERDRAAGERHRARRAARSGRSTEVTSAPTHQAITTSEQDEAARTDRRRVGVAGRERGGGDGEDRGEPGGEGRARRAVTRRRRVVVAQARQLERGVDAGHRDSLRIVGPVESNASITRSSVRRRGAGGHPTRRVDGQHEHHEQPGGDGQRAPGARARRPRVRCPRCGRRRSTRAGRRGCPAGSPRRDRGRRS